MASGHSYSQQHDKYGTGYTYQQQRNSKNPIANYYQEHPTGYQNQSVQQSNIAYYEEQRRTAEFQAKMQQSYKQVHPVQSGMTYPTTPMPYPGFHPVNPHQPSHYAHQTAYVAQSQPMQDHTPKKETPSQGQKSAGFPPSLQTYVQVALKACLKDKERKQQVEAMLKVIVEDAMRKNTMWNRDWSRELPPELLYSQITGSAFYKNTGKSVTQENFANPASEYQTTKASDSNAETQMPSNTNIQPGTPGLNDRQSKDVQQNIELYKRSSNYEEQSEMVNKETTSGRLDPYVQGDPKHNSPSKSDHAQSSHEDMYKSASPAYDFTIGMQESRWNSSSKKSKKPKKKKKRKAKKANRTKENDTTREEYTPLKRSKVSEQAVGTHEHDKRNQRKARFSTNTPVSEKVRWNPYKIQQDAHRIRSAIRDAEQSGEGIDLSKFVVKGTSTALEKPYLRLTSAPDPATVRPEKVLIESLKLVKRRWRKRRKYTDIKAMEARTPYAWASEQLKSIRQDLTVQHIENEFTVNVYETHARIAIEQEDLTEFNQCQTKLVELYRQSLGNHERQNEFAAYRIFYQLYVRHKYNSPSTEMALLLASLGPSQRRSSVVQHALKVRAAVHEGDYAGFFYLYEIVENLGVYLLDLIIDYVRHIALRRICRAFRPAIPLIKVQEMLLYSKNSKEWSTLISNPKVKFLKNGVPVESFSSEETQYVSLATKSSYPFFNNAFQWRVLKGDNVQRTDAGE